MKKSIKWRITIIFVVVIICCLGGVYVFNTLFLEKLYINKREAILKKTYVSLDEIITNAYQKGYKLKDLIGTNKKVLRPGFLEIDKNTNNLKEPTLVRFLQEIQDVYNISVVLVDGDNNYYSLFQNIQRFDRRIMSYIFQNNKEDNNLKIIEENEKYKITLNIFDDRGKLINSDAKSLAFKKGHLECFGFLSDNSTAFLLSTPLESVKEPVELFNNVLIILSIFSIAIGSIIIYLNAYRIAVPIKKLALLSEKMAKLDFNSKYDDVREDEIGILGNSMNEMSYKLEKTIRELKNANIQLKNDIEQREKLDKMREEFIANVSHELKTPIALIQSYAEGLQCGMATKKEDKDYYIDVIIDESDKMNKMVHQLLNLSSLESEVGDFDIDRINLYEVVSSVVKSQEIVIQQKNIDLKIKIQKNIYVWMDEFRLEELIRNYLTNAINHINNYKIINIYTNKLNDEKIEIVVFNTGEHLSDENLKNIWEKFYKTDKARTRAYGGTGLGLSIVKAIASKLGNECGCRNIFNDDKKQDGIEFYFVLNLK